MISEALFLACILCRVQAFFYLHFLVLARIIKSSKKIISSKEMGKGLVRFVRKFLTDMFIN